jgi:hypothetical protein
VLLPLAALLQWGTLLLQEALLLLLLLLLCWLHVQQPSRQTVRAAAC